ncbi:MAG: DUF3784 domain-containing protein [Bacilli bacterium]|nr:DUF3784 domain-containing protein [Bacilli bacterium]MDD4584791.1 DUF3784 domain-containing protein [Bacilli bacterium]
MFFSIILLVIAILCFVVVYFAIKNKGPIISNQYLFSTKEEREKLKTKQEYRNSSIIFLFLGVMFLLEAISVYYEISWLSFVVVILSVILIVFVIFISVKSIRK